MNRGEIRSDLITAWVIQEWLVKHHPHLASDWAFDVNDSIKSLAARLKVMFPPIERIFIGQASIARLAIERWDLKNVAVLGAGTPTPISPRPDQVRYFTDANPAVLEEAKRAGYHTEQADVRNPSDLKKLDGATTVIATGLFHFLDDGGARKVFSDLAHAGFRMMVFNHMMPTSAAGQQVANEYSKFGFQLYPRTQGDIEVLFDGHWTMTDAPRIETFHRGHEIFDALLGSTGEDDEVIVHQVYLASSS